MKLTDWYPGDVKPYRKGVYERKYKYGKSYNYWDGKNWFIGAANVIAALSYKYHKHGISCAGNVPWRGVRKD